MYSTLPEVLLTDDGFTPTYTKEILLNALVKHGYYPNFLLNNMPLFTKYLTQNNRLFNDEHPMLFYKHEISDEERSKLVIQFNGYFMRFCEQHDLVLLLWKFVSHYE